LSSVAKGLSTHLGQLRNAVFESKSQQQKRIDRRWKMQ